MELHDIVTKLVGPVVPLGDESRDGSRLENLKTLIDLTEQLIYDITLVSSFSNRQEHSLSRAGNLAKEFIESIEK